MTLSYLVTWPGPQVKAKVAAAWVVLIANWGTPLDLNRESPYVGCPCALEGELRHRPLLPLSLTALWPQGLTQCPSPRMPTGDRTG